MESVEFHRIVSIWFGFSNENSITYIYYCDEKMVKHTPKLRIDKSCAEFCEKYGNTKS